MGLGGEILLLLGVIGCGVWWWVTRVHRSQSPQRRRAPSGKVRHDSAVGPGPDWRKMTAFYQSIVGERFRVEEHQAYLAAGGGGIEIVREAQNAHDANALAVYAVAGDGGARLKLGYLPRGFAAEVAATRPRDMPIKAVPISTYTAASGFRDMKIDVYEPSVRSGYWRALGLEPPGKIRST